MSRIVIMIDTSNVLFQDYPGYELRSIFRSLANVTTTHAAVVAGLDGKTIRDSSGNPVGSVQVDPPDPAAGLLAAIRAIQARIKGEYDNPDLVKFGPLMTDRITDIVDIVEAAIAKYEAEKPPTL